MTNAAYWGWPASVRRLALALAASACAHAAVLANVPFAPGPRKAALIAFGPPIQARLAAQPPAVAFPEFVAQRSAAARAAASREPSPESDAGDAGAAGPAGLPAAEIFYRGRELDERAQATNHPDLEYPESALAAGVTGKVTLRLRIDRLGALRDVSVTEAQPPGVFEAAALKAARSLKFKPAIRNGVPVGSIKLIEVPFEPDCNRTGSCNN